MRDHPHGLLHLSHAPAHEAQQATHEARLRLEPLTTITPLPGGLVLPHLIGESERHSCLELSAKLRSDVRWATHARQLLVHQRHAETKGLLGGGGELCHTTVEKDEEALVGAKLELGPLDAILVAAAHDGARRVEDGLRHQPVSVTSGWVTDGDHEIWVGRLVHAIKIVKASGLDDEKDRVSFRVCRRRRSRNAWLEHGGDRNARHACCDRRVDETRRAPLLPEHEATLHVYRR